MKKVSLLFLFLFIACGAQETAELTTGEEIYTARCAACHQADFSGRAGPSLKTARVLDMRDEYWVQTMLNGKGSMRVVRIIEEQAEVVIEYVRDS